MEKYNVIKKWTVNKHTYRAFVTVERNMSLTSAEWQLENERLMQASIIGNDCDQECGYDNSLYGKFSMTCNGVKFEYEIEEVQPEKNQRKLNIHKYQLN